MLKRLYKILFLSVYLFSSSFAVIARNYITGKAFKGIADYIVEKGSHNFNPETVAKGSIIYIEADHIGYFFEKVFPKLREPIIVLSHNSDASAPGKCVKYLDDAKVIMWFGQNCDIAHHPKFCAIPIGTANPEWEHGNQKILDEVLDKVDAQVVKTGAPYMYMNFAVSTNPVRSMLYDAFKNKDFVVRVPPKPFREYLLEMACFRYVLSPWGNGLDCHRTWEALLVGAIPVVNTSTLDPLYVDLPVIIVEDWSMITKDFLEKQHKKMITKSFDKSKLFFDYWRNLITTTKEQNR